MRIPVGDAAAIYLQSPMIAAILARILLKESLPKLTPIIIILAIIGIIFITQPSFLTIFGTNSSELQSLNIDGVVSILFSLIFWSIACILVRFEKGNAHFLQYQITTSLIMLLIAEPILVIVNYFTFNDSYIGGIDIWNYWSFKFTSWCITIVFGLMSFIGLTCVVIGYQYDDATKIAWIEYNEVIIGYIYQIIIFNDIPDLFDVIGIILLSIASLLTVIEELYKYYTNINDNDELYEY